MDLHDLITEKFNVDYPIRGGTGSSRDNPIIIEAHEPNSDYGAVERAVLHSIAQVRDISWEMIESKRFTYKGRELEQLEVEIRQMVQGVIKASSVNYYFDITECLD